MGQNSTDTCGNGYVECQNTTKIEERSRNHESGVRDCNALNTYFTFLINFFLKKDENYRYNVTF